jgi:hypothetical protein
MTMDSDGKFWIICWSLVATVIVAFFIGAFIGGGLESERYYAAQANCLAKGGSWLPVRGNDAFCLMLQAKQ